LYIIITEKQKNFIHRLVFLTKLRQKSNFEKDYVKFFLKEVVDLIRLSNGHQFDYVAASGSLGYDGTGWWFKKILNWLIKPKLFIAVGKTVTRFKEKGNFRWWNPLGCVKFLRGPNGLLDFIGVINAVALRNPGIEWLVKKVGPKISRKKLKLIASVYFKSETEMLEIAEMLNGMDLVAVEVNISCSNILASPFWHGPEAIVQNCRELKKVLRHPIILKISVEHEVEQFLPQLRGVVEAISINSVRWRLIFPKKKSPLARFGGGGVSGKVTQPIVWPFIMDIVRQTRIPVIGSAIWDYGDMAAVRRMGAKAVSFGSVFMPYPWRPASFVKKEMEKKK